LQTALKKSLEMIKLKNAVVFVNRNNENSEENLLSYCKEKGYTICETLDTDCKADGYIFLVAAASQGCKDETIGLVEDINLLNEIFIRQLVVLKDILKKENISIESINQGSLSYEELFDLLSEEEKATVSLIENAPTVAIALINISDDTSGIKDKRKKIDEICERENLDLDEIYVIDFNDKIESGIELYRFIKKAFEVDKVIIDSIGSCYEILNTYELLNKPYGFGDTTQVEVLEDGTKVSLSDFVENSFLPPSAFEHPCVEQIPYNKVITIINVNSLGYENDGHVYNPLSDYLFNIEEILEYKSYIQRNMYIISHGSFDAKDIADDISKSDADSLILINIDSCLTPVGRLVDGLSENFKVIPIAELKGEISSFGNPVSYINELLLDFFKIKEN